MTTGPVEQVYLWVTQHSDSDADLTIASMNGMPLLAASRCAAQSLKPLAQRMADVSGKKMKLLMYSIVAELDATG